MRHVPKSHLVSEFDRFIYFIYTHLSRLSSHLSPENADNIPISSSHASAVTVHTLYMLYLVYIYPCATRESAASRKAVPDDMCECSVSERTTSCYT